MQRKQLWLVLVLLMGLGILWLWKQNEAPQPFVFTVDNQSHQQVEQVRLFGSALDQDALLFNIDPASSAAITVNARKSGTLKFEVSQGLNRIDTFIVEDTRLLDDWSQRLVVEDNNRFLLHRD